MRERDEQREPQYATVLRFTRAIIQAVHDAGHEQEGNARIAHFWDTDSLYLPARGASVYSDGTATARLETTTFVQSLFATGFLGKVQLLRPHRAEFIALLAEWEDDKTLKKRFERGRDNILGGDDLALLRALEDRLERYDDLDDAAQREAVEFLRAVPREEFTYLEAASGSWQGRLGRLLDLGLLDLGRHGLETSFLRDTPEFATIFEKLSNQMHGGASPMSIAADAAALASLMYMIQAAADGERLFPRFFTSTPRLKRLYDEWPWLRGKLEFESDGLAPTTATVWRDSVYYLVRAIFPALRMPGRVQDSPPGDSSSSLSSLHDLSQRLIEALRESEEVPSRQLRELLRETVFEDEQATLAHVISRLEENRVTSAWLSFAAGVDPEATVQSLSGLRRLAREERAQQLITDVDRSSIHDIREEVREFRSAATVVAAVERFGKFLGKGEISVKDDLGSARWGIELPDSLDTISFNPGASGAVDSLTEEFSLEALQGNPRSQLRTIGILFGMERFDLAAELLPELTKKPLPPQSAMLRAVARIRSQPFSQKKLVKTVRQLQHDWDELSDGERPAQALGFAIAAFYAWQRGSEGKEKRTLGDDEDWAQWSIDRVQEWRDQLTPHALLQAKNHLVYVATVADKAIPDYASMLVELEAHANQHNDFHLLDTVGFAIVHSFMADPEKPLEDIDAARFRQGLAYLERARTLFPDDLEIIGHEQLAVAFARAKGLSSIRI